MKEFVQQILTNKTSCYFISPAFGDAAASCGELLAELAAKVDVTIVNVFTNPGDGQHTFSAKRFLKHAKTTNVQALYESKQQEDERALALFPVTSTNLNCTDALWRKKKKKNALGSYIPEFGSLYPTYKHIMSGHIAKEDQNFIHQLQESLRGTIKEKENYIVFCPIGFFNHVDYLIIRNACQELFKENCIFYSLPIPDTADKAKTDFIRKHSLEQVVCTSSSEKKWEVLKAYESQSQDFFGTDSLVFTPEIYFHYTPAVEKKYEVKVYDQLTEAIQTEWQQVWSASPLKNFCNSPLWFQATLQTFDYKQVKIFICYENDLPVAVLPLVLSLRYGTPTYTTPGNQFYDNSSLLLSDLNPVVIKTLLQKGQDLGNIYLAEVSKPVATIVSTDIPQMSVIQSKASSCPYLIPQPDPFRFMTKKNRRILAKKFKDAGSELSYELFETNAIEHLPTLLKIDQSSRKKAAFKDTFGDPHFKQLLENINKFNKHTVIIALLMYQNEPICYNFGIMYDEIFMGFGTAYNDTWHKFSPGRLLVYYLLPALVEKGVQMLDFSRGISRFKQDFTPYFYPQYAIAYTKDPATAIRWKTLDRIKLYLEANPGLFEFARKTKKRILR